MRSARAGSRRVRRKLVYSSNYAWRKSVGGFPGGFRKETFDLHAGNHLVTDGVRRMEFPPFQEPMNGDIGNSQDLRRLAHSVRETGQGRYGFDGVLRR